MFNLSTINASTIHLPETRQAVADEVRNLRAANDAIGAAALRTYLERQLSVVPTGSTRESYEALLRELASFSGVSDGETNGRVAVRDEAGRVRLYADGQYIEAESPSPAPPSMAPQVANRQSELAKTAAFSPFPVAYDNPEDEEEIRRHSNRLTSFQLGDAHDIGSIVDDIIDEDNLEFSERSLELRFRMIAESRIKDVRTSRDTVALLTRPVNIGGLGLSSESAEAVVISLERAAAQVRDQLPAVKPKTLAQTEAPKPAPPKIPVQSPPLVRRSAPPPPLPRQPLPFRQPAVSSRPVMEDIRPPEVATRLIGPIDELRQLTPEEFRRWGGGDPAAAVRKIYEKIVLLGQESFGKRIEGVQAWRISPMHQLYLAMSEASLSAGQGVDEVARLRSAAQQSYLTDGEFHAIVDLNRQLRF